MTGSRSKRVMEKTFLIVYNFKPLLKLFFFSGRGSGMERESVQKPSHKAVIVRGTRLPLNLLKVEEKVEKQICQELTFPNQIRTEF